MNCLALGSFGAACLICFLALILVLWRHLFHINSPKNLSYLGINRSVISDWKNVSADTVLRSSVLQTPIQLLFRVPVLQLCAVRMKQCVSSARISVQFVRMSCPPLLTPSFRLQFVAIVADMTCTLTAVCCVWQYTCCMKDTAVTQHFWWLLRPRLLRCGW